MNELKYSIKAGNRRFVAFILALLLILENGMFFQKTYAMGEESGYAGEVLFSGDASATLNDNVTYTVTRNADLETYTLTFSGTGAIKEYNYYCDRWHFPITYWNGYSNITNVVIEEGITEVPQDCMSYTDIKSVYISSTVETINENAFRCCWYLEDVVFAKNSKLKKIGDYAFSYVKENIVNLPKDIIYGKEVFLDTDLTELSTVVDGMYIFNDSVFLGVSEDFKSEDGKLTIPEGITTIWSYAGKKNYYNVDLSLKEITLPSSITNIMDNAFYNDKEVSVVTIPEDNNLRYVSRNSFSDNTLKAIDYVLGSVLLGVDEKDLVKTETSEGDEYTYYVPDNITVIASGRANNYNRINNIVFGENSKLEYILDEAFYSSGLKRINLPNTVKYIGSNAFACNSLEEINIPENLEVIEDSTFYMSGLESVTIPSNVKKIGNEAFECCGLKEVVFEENSKLTTIGDRAFTSNKYINGGLIKEFTIPSGVKYIGEYAFYNFNYDINDDAETKLIADENATFIMKDAGIASNKEVIVGKVLVKAPSDVEGKYVVPDGIEVIAEKAFANTSYSSIDCNNVKVIEDYAFSNMENLESIRVSRKTDRIGRYIFEYACGNNDNCIDTVYCEKGSEFEKFINTVHKANYEYNPYCEPDVKNISHDGFKPVYSGWQKIDNKWYYYSPVDGTMQTGWLKLSGKWYYFDKTGVMQTGWVKVSGKWYYFETTGAMQTGWKKISNKWYYFETTGAMQTGWKKISNKWYYFETTGAMQTGWKKISGKWYYFETTGAMQTGWKKISNKWYYFETTGAMATSKWIDGYYYVDANGVMATNQWIDGKYYVGADGKWIKDYKG